MKKIGFFLKIILIFLPVALEAKYCYEETFSMPLPENTATKWKVAYQKADETGSCSTRYVLENETLENWKQLLNMQFKDKKVASCADAEEAMKKEAANSKWVQYKILKKESNDLIYERTFPSGEHEIVRMVMTQKGLHRIAYVKRGKFTDEEKTQWVQRLSSGTIKSKT